jgi:ring-1,2-phenylacetyl-CoA epoxidase subunit PaaC
MHNRQALIDYTLHLADDALILGHRNSEWTGYGPALEQDIAISNIALDLIGQARNFYQYAARLINGIPPAGSADASERGPSSEVSEDSLAYLRDAWDFKNCLLAEQTNGDWAKTILRQFFFSTCQYYLYEELQSGPDSELAAISEKALKEVTYHLRWSSEWVIRLGDGTEESRSRLLKALDELWKFTGEPFMAARYELKLKEEGIGADLSLLQHKWDKKITEIFAEAGLAIPAGKDGEKGWMQSGGKEGRHTEHLGYILAEMQFLQRAYPGCEW